MKQNSTTKKSDSQKSNYYFKKCSLDRYEKS